MKTIHVMAAFSLLLRGGVKVDVPAGVQTVEDEVADHWYTQGFLAHGGLGSKEYAEAAWGAVNTAFLKAEEAIHEYEQLLKASAEADDAAGIEDRVPPHMAAEERRYQARVAERDAAETGEPEPIEPPADAPVGETAGENGGQGGTEGEGGQHTFHPLDRDHVDGPGGDLADGYRWADDGLGGGEAIVDAAGTVVARTAEELRALLAAGNAGDEDQGGGTQGDASDNAESQEGADDQPKALTAEELEGKTDDELRALIKDRDGKAPNGRLGREKLLALALTPGSASDEDQA